MSVPITIGRSRVKVPSRFLLEDPTMSLRKEGPSPACEAEDFIHQMFHFEKKGLNSLGRVLCISQSVRKTVTVEDVIHPRILAELSLSCTFVAWNLQLLVENLGAISPDQRLKHFFRKRGYIQGIIMTLLTQRLGFEATASLAQKLACLKAEIPDCYRLT